MFDLSKGVSNQEFGRGGAKTDNDKLTEPNAKDHVDSIAPNNELKQFLGGAAKGKMGKLGKMGRDF